MNSIKCYKYVLGYTPDCMALLTKNIWTKHCQKISIIVVEKKNHWENTAEGLVFYLLLCLKLRIIYQT